MHTQSKSWNLPDGLVGEEADSGKSRVHEKSARPLRGCGLANELPSAGDAMELFKKRLEALLKSAELLLDAWMKVFAGSSLSCTNVGIWLQYFAHGTVYRKRCGQRLASSTNATTKALGHRRSQ